MSLTPHALRNPLTVAKGATEIFPPTHGEPLAVAPEALGRRYPAAAAGDAELLAADVAVVAIRGPLMNHAHWLFDSYDAIRGRMASALALGAKRVVLDIDSPGGLAAGCMDCARELRTMAKAGGVELVAWVGAQATSAAYAIASAADRIAVSSTATLGSIGVLGGLVDMTKALEADGVRVEMIGSGARKGDGHPAKPITPEAIAAVQRHVDGLAAEFFELVASHGWMGGDASAVKALEARTVLGAEAVELGLASEVTTYSRIIGATTAQERETTMNRSEILRTFAVALGLDAECSDEALVEAAQAQLAPRAELDAARARATAAEQALEAQRAEAFAARVEDAVGAAVAAGKLTPASATYHRTMIRDAAALEAFEAHVAELAVVVDGDPNAEDGPEEGATGPTLTAEDREVARMLGLTDEEFAAGRPAA